MVYITHTRLIRESESSVASCAEFGAEPAQHICSQLLDSEPRYATWMSSHDRRMTVVSRGRSRERQIVSLRLVATEQIHRQALVRYLRDNEIRGEQREIVLKEFYGPLDSRNAVLAAHREFTQAVSSHVCAADLLELCADRHGTKMLHQYEYVYGLYFAMHCDRARAVSEGRTYLLGALLPEVKASAKGLRDSLLSGNKLPTPKFSLSNRRLTNSRPATR
ncbi:MAG TPA: hypothetical protein VMR74_00440 [Gammaproteobacteria bacterium]|nr:hypothetical protein [Gammaproteobacteria bacterium]